MKITAKEVIRTDDEKRADKMCEALDLIIGNNQSVQDVIWEYFRDGKDQLALMLMQAQALDSIYGALDTIATEGLNVNTWEQNRE